MKSLNYIIFCLVNTIVFVSAGLEYLDPTKLQTRKSIQVQQDAALKIISKYLSSVEVEVNPITFYNQKDMFTLRTIDGKLSIRASTGVAAVWGFNYYLKKYCNSQIEWQNSNVNIPDPLPEVNEYVIANDRFRYYENVCTASYSFVWWNVEDWLLHVEWMALNGINMALAPIAQEAAWARVYKELGLSDDEIEEHFTGPAFLAWLRMGNVRGWGGPLPNSWQDQQLKIQNAVVDYMFQLGIVPVLPSFNGHVPKAFSRVFSNATYYQVGSWNKFKEDYCCGLFLDPSDQLFKNIGKMFLKEITAGAGIGSGHIYSVDPFNEVNVTPWSTGFVKQTATAIYSTISEFDDRAVWLLQNWMFVHDPLVWPKTRVETFITAVPNGRMLVLDLQSEQWPQYFLYDMYFGQPFIWCMLHNFGGTSGMFGSMQIINKEVYEVRNIENSTMIGIGLTPEGINQNYVVYDLMLESAWRKAPVIDLNEWVEDYAKRRYACNATTGAWPYLLKSVYSYNGLKKIRGQYVVTKRPSFKLKPWAWYKSHDLFEGWRRIVFADKDQCNNGGFHHDLVDVTRQALQYRAEQLYLNMLKNRNQSTLLFNSSITMFLEVMDDMRSILGTDSDFSIAPWLNKARRLATNDEDSYLYELNARNQITLWGPNGEITDYASKQWAELFQYYYYPRWKTFLDAALEAKVEKEPFDEKGAQQLVRVAVEQRFARVNIKPTDGGDAKSLAIQLYTKWSNVADLDDLPIIIIEREVGKVTLPDVGTDTEEQPLEVTRRFGPTVLILTSTVDNVV